MKGKLSFARLCRLVPNLRFYIDVEMTKDQCDAVQLNKREAEQNRQLKRAKQLAAGTELVDIIGVQAHQRCSVAAGAKNLLKL